MNKAENLSFDQMVTDLQQEIIRQEREIFSETVIAEAHHPQNVGRMAQADAQAIFQGWCGDTMEFYLRMNDDVIEEIAFMTDGCGATVACGSRLTQMVQGLPWQEAIEITPENLIAVLGGLPEENEHCATLAVKTLRQAIADWQGS
ncbi:MAG TPA: iron-sulfur cluster assembly scaffold protein [Chloroflexi bacterium]|nr:iron-sulfur cluster assembly scaffold protein [Chloroflexota bacterium]